MRAYNLGTVRWFLLAAPLALACSGNGLNPGNTGTGGGGGSLQLAAYAGTWVGHAESYSFGSDGSDQVQLTLDATGKGTMMLGATMLPPPTDPNVEYPPGVTEQGSTPGVGYVTEGFPYPTHATRVEAGRLQFGINTSDVFAGWCALQTPVVRNQLPDGDGGVQTFYSCGPNLGTGPSNLPDAGGPQCAYYNADGSIEAVVDCGKQSLCGFGSVCACNQSSCTAGGDIASATVPAQYPISWDAGLDAAGSMTATLVNQSLRLTIHLTRQ